MYGEELEKKVRKNIYKKYNLHIHFGWDSTQNEYVIENKATIYKWLFKEQSETNTAITNLGVRTIFIEDEYTNQSLRIPMKHLYYTPHDFEQEVSNHIIKCYPEFLLK